MDSDLRKHKTPTRKSAKVKDTLSSVFKRVSKDIEIECLSYRFGSWSRFAPSGRLDEGDITDIKYGDPIRYTRVRVRGFVEHHGEYMVVVSVVGASSRYYLIPRANILFKPL